MLLPTPTLPQLAARKETAPPPPGYTGWEGFCSDNPDDARCANVGSFYNYRLDLAANVAFLALFGLSLGGFVLAWAGRSYVRPPRGESRRLRGSFFSGALLLGTLCEVLGYVGRVMSWHNAWSEDPFFIQIVCLTIGPAFVSAGIYYCLQRIIIIYGPQYSFFRPSLYTKIFIPCDVLSLVLQAAGGGMASAAFHSGGNIDPGDNVMIAGLVLQVITMLGFIIAAGFFALNVVLGRRRERRQALATGAGAGVLSTGTTAVASAAASAGALHHNLHHGNAALSPWEAAEALRVRRWWYFRAFLAALGVAALTVFWRCIFRVAELSKGWNGPLTYRQGLFIGFESVMVVVACLVLNAFNPLFALGSFLDDRGLAEAQAAAASEEAYEKPHSPTDGAY